MCHVIVNDVIKYGSLCRMLKKLVDDKRLCVEEMKLPELEEIGSEKMDPLYYLPGLDPDVLEAAKNKILTDMKGLIFRKKKVCVRVYLYHVMVELLSLDLISGSHSLSFYILYSAKGGKEGCEEEEEEEEEVV